MTTATYADEASLVDPSHPQHEMLQQMAAYADQPVTSSPHGACDESADLRPPTITVPRPWFEEILRDVQGKVAMLSRTHLMHQEHLDSISRGYQAELMELRAGIDRLNRKVEHLERRESRDDKAAAAAALAHVDKCLDGVYRKVDTALERSTIAVQGFTAIADKGGEADPGITMDPDLTVVDKRDSSGRERRYYQTKGGKLWPKLQHANVAAEAERRQAVKPPTASFVSQRVPADKQYAVKGDLLYKVRQRNKDGSVKLELMGDKSRWRHLWLEGHYPANRPCPAVTLV